MSISGRFSLREFQQSDYRIKNEILMSTAPDGFFQPPPNVLESVRRRYLIHQKQLGRALREVLANLQDVDDRTFTDTLESIVIEKKSLGIGGTLADELISASQEMRHHLNSGGFESFFESAPEGTIRALLTCLQHASAEHRNHFNSVLEELGIDKEMSITSRRSAIKAFYENCSYGVESVIYRMNAEYRDSPYPNRKTLENALAAIEAELLPGV